MVAHIPIGCSGGTRWEANENLQGMDYRAGWRYIVDCYALRDKEFYKFMESTFRGDHPLVKMYEEKYGP